LRFGDKWMARQLVKATARLLRHEGIRRDVTGWMIARRDKPAFDPPLVSSQTRSTNGRF
jgi:hypothetical protein